MALTFNRDLDSVQPSGIRYFAGLVRQTPGACGLTIGEPDLNTPEEVKAAAAAALADNDTHYPPNNGYPALLEAISRFEAEKNGLRYDPEEIIVTAGATEALFVALSGILDPGDEVIIPAPAFGLYESIVRLRGAVPVFLPTEDNGFQIDPAALKQALTDRTKAIVLTSPNNPTGCVYTAESLRAVREAVGGRNIFVICDDVYRQLIYTGDYHSFAENRDLREQLLVVQSFSKPYAMTGWRVGYLLADRTVKERLELLHQYMVVSTPAPFQSACIRALDFDPHELVETYRRRRAYVLSRLDAMGLPVTRPDGAFYVFPSIAAYGMDSGTFCTRMIREAGLAATPGACFGGEGHIRLTYCYGDETLKAGLDRLEGFLKTL